MKIQLNNLNLYNNFKCSKSTNNQILSGKSVDYFYKYPSFTGISRPDIWLANLGKQNQVIKYLVDNNGKYYPESYYHIENRPIIVSNNTGEQYGEFLYEKLLPNREVRDVLLDLDDCSEEEKERFIKTFEHITGFFNFEAIKERADDEILSSVEQLLERYNLSNDDLKFIGYDKNCSLGRTIALPGSDADALFIIIDDSKSHDKWITAKMRWDLKDVVNQRIISTPAHHLPEVLSVGFLKRGLELANMAYKRANFSSEDLWQFRQNLQNSSNDFVKCADFNIRLAELLPCDTQTRDEFYKTAMLVELIRNGEVLVNNLPEEFIAEIKQSPLYKYSNLVRQEGLKNSEKYKYQRRRKLQEKYHNGDTNTRFKIIKELLKENYNTGSDKNNSMYSNTQKDGSDVMGNINEMWNRIMNQVKH